MLCQMAIKGGNRCGILVNVNTLELIGSACVTLKINSTLSIRDSDSRQLLKVSNCKRRSVTMKCRVSCMPPRAPYCHLRGENCHFEGEVLRRLIRYFSLF